MVTRQLRQLTLVHNLLETGENQAKIGTLLGISSNYAVQKTVEQAINRSGAKAGNRGADAAVAAIAMTRTVQNIREMSKPKSL